MSERVRFKREHTPWMKPLLESSDERLLVWADWLEERGDAACEGVRDLLVAQHKRLRHYRLSAEFTWWDRGIYRPGENPEREDDLLPTAVIGQLTYALYGGDGDCNYRYRSNLRHNNANSTLGTMARSHYIALYDAALAWSKLSQELRHEVQTTSPG